MDVRQFLAKTRPGDNYSSICATICLSTTIVRLQQLFVQQLFVYDNCSSTKIVCLQQLFVRQLIVCIY